MSCSGLHCGGCAGGSAVPVAAFAAFLGVDWVAAHLVEVVATSAVCGALAVAAVVALMRWADRQDARRAVTWRLLSARQVPAVVTAEPAAVGGAERAALGFRDLHIHLDGQPDPRQAEVIRQALGRG